MITRLTNKQWITTTNETKIYNKKKCCSLLRVNSLLFFKYFFRSILENRMLFWIDIIGYRSPQVLQVLQHYYKYHWQLVQVILLLFGSIRPYIRIRSPVLYQTQQTTHSTLIFFARFFLLHDRNIVINYHQQWFVVWSILHPNKCSYGDL